MRENKLVKVFVCLMMFFIILGIPFTVKATINASTDIDTIIQQGKDFTEKGKTGGNLIKEDELADLVMPIGQLLIGLGGIVAVSATLILGIKYMTTNPEQKGKLKQQLVGLVISTVVIFGAWGIWSFTYNLLVNLESDITAETIEGGNPDITKPDVPDYDPKNPFSRP